MLNDDFTLKEVDGSITMNGKTHHYRAFRLFHKETGKQFGEYFQESCRSPEWRAAYICYDKYRRKMNLELDDLRKLTKFVMDFSQKRKDEGKKVSNDYLIQIASKEIKTYNKV